MRKESDHVGDSARNSSTYLNGAVREVRGAKLVAKAWKYHCSESLSNTLIEGSALIAGLKILRVATLFFPFLSTYSQVTPKVMQRLQFGFPSSHFIFLFLSCVSPIFNWLLFGSNLLATKTPISTMLHPLGSLSFRLFLWFRFWRHIFLQHKVNDLKRRMVKWSIHFMVKFPFRREGAHCGCGLVSHG